jgi:Glyoxalase-like domain
MSATESRADGGKEGGPGGIWMGSIVIDCTDWDRMVEFWTAALHYTPRDPPDDEGVVLKDPEGRSPNLSLYRTIEKPLNDYRLHLDLYSTDLEKEVDRLLRIGAQFRRRSEGGEEFVTLSDPDGNLFDVIDKKGWPSGRRA